MRARQAMIPMLVSAMIMSPVSAFADQLQAEADTEMIGMKNTETISQSELSEEKLSKILEDVKQRVVILDEGANFSYSVGLDSGQNYYNLRWETDGYVQEVRYGDDRGIYNYSYYEKQDSYRGESTKKLPKYSKVEAEAIAKDFISQAQPQNYKDYSLESNDLNGNIYYMSFSYKREAIKVNGLTARVSVDATTGKLTSFYTSYNPMTKFDTRSGIISVKEAEKIYKDQIGLKKIYTYDYNHDNKKIENIKMVYVPGRDMGYSINAKTGKVEKDSYSIYRSEGGMGAGEEMSKDSLTPEERKEIQSKAGLKSMEEAVKAATNMGLVDKNLSLTRSNLYERSNQESEYIWSLSYQKEDEYFGLELDARNLDLISYYGPSSYDSSYKIDEKSIEKAKMRAETFVKEHGSKYRDRILLEDISLDELMDRKTSVISLSYSRFENDAYLPGDGISILYDIAKDKVTSYGVNWTKINLPKYSNFANPDRIFEKIFTENKLGLSYKLQFNNSGQSYEAKLYYDIENPSLPLMFAADTGERVLTETQSKPIDYTDINRSKYPEEIRALANLGIGFSEEQLQPQKVISQREFLDLMLQTKGYGYVIPLRDSKTETKKYIEAGLLLEGEAVTDQGLSREASTKYLVRAAGYEKLARHSEIFTSKLPDLEESASDLRGYLIIANSLGYTDTGLNTNFAPKQMATREAALKMIYNYLALQ